MNFLLGNIHCRCSSSTGLVAARTAKKDVASWSFIFVQRGWGRDSYKTIHWVLVFVEKVEYDVVSRCIYIFDSQSLVRYYLFGSCLGFACPSAFFFV
jgi:hypothetical protein